MKRKEAVFLAGLELLKDCLNDKAVRPDLSDMQAWGGGARKRAESFCGAFEFDGEADHPPAPGWSEGSGFTPTSERKPKAGAPTAGSGFTVAPTDLSVESERRRVYSKLCRMLYHAASDPPPLKDGGFSRTELSPAQVVATVMRNLPKDCQIVKCRLRDDGKCPGKDECSLGLPRGWLEGEGDIGGGDGEFGNDQ